MDYTQFCCHNEHITSLSKIEIKNPFAVLESIYKRNPKDLKKSLWDFFWIIYKEQQWKINGPEYYYNIYMELIKLIDALWLINRCQPMLSTTSPNPYQSSSKPMKTFNRVFEQMRKKHQTKESKNNETNLHKFYGSTSLSATKSHLYNYLKVGLNASHMSNDKHYYYAVNKNDIIIDFINLECLIDEGQSIYKKNKTMTQSSEYKKHLKFGSDTDHTTILGLESITDPLDLIKHLYYYHLVFKQLPISLNIWKKSLNEKTFWLDADSPGNILFLADCLKELIECIWLLVQKDQINMGTANRILNRNQKKQYPTLNEMEISQPSTVVEDFFNYKKMHEWKNVLDSWANISLSNTKTIDMTKASIDLNCLLRFIEASHLLAS